MKKVYLHNYSEISKTMLKIKILKEITQGRKEKKLKNTRCKNVTEKKKDYMRREIVCNHKMV